MSAEFNIHVIQDPCTIDDAITFMAPITIKKEDIVTIRYPKPDDIFNQEEYIHEITTDKKTYNDIWTRVMNTPSVWVGEVSWLKADLSGDPDRYIPSVVGSVADLFPHYYDEQHNFVPEFRKIDHQMIREVIDIYTKCEPFFIKTPKKLQRMITEANRRNKKAYPYRYKWDRNTHCDVTRYRVSRKKHIIDFLIKYIGYDAFTVSW